MYTPYCSPSSSHQFRSDLAVSAATNSHPCYIGGFSFEVLFGDLVDDLLPEYRGEDDSVAASYSA